MDIDLGFYQVGRNSSYRRHLFLSVAAAISILSWQGIGQAQTVNYRSIGANAGVLANSGTATISVGSTTVTFSNPLPTSVGVGDELTLDPGGPNQEGPFYVVRRDSHTQITVDRVAGIDHSGGDFFEMRRAFRGATAIQVWENARDGDLVLDDRVEVGVVYNDGPFTAGGTINGSTTDATHYMRLTVAPGQRHNGTAGTGALLDGGDTIAGEIIIQDNYTVVEWLELTRTRGPNFISSVRILAADVVLSHLLIYDASRAINITGVVGDNFTARNCIIYSCDDTAIEGDQNSDSALIENCTIYGNAGDGIDDSGSLFTVRNTISLSNVGDDFNITNGTQEHNMSSDLTAVGLNPITGAMAANEFVNPGTDFHLRPTAQAIDAGRSLSPSFSSDIDNESRPSGPQWDMGADEFMGTITIRSIGNAGPSAGCCANTVNGSPLVTGSGTNWLSDNRGRGDQIILDSGNYVILRVESDQRLILTGPFTGATGSHNYTISRQFPTLQTWMNCISFAGSCGNFPVPSASLVADQRKEEGVVYDDGPLTAGLVMAGAVTDPFHDITLTAIDTNRHYGLFTQGAVLDMSGTGTTGIVVGVDYATIEWLQIRGNAGAASGIEVANVNAANRIVLRDLLIHNLPGDGIRVTDNNTNARIYNNFIYSTQRGIHFVPDLIGTSGIDVLNNTVFACSDGIFSTASQSTPLVTLQNNISVGNNPGVDYGVGLVTAASGSNISEDPTAAPPHSPFDGGYPGTAIGALQFVSTAGGSENLHITGGSFAEDKGLDLSSAINHDIDAALRAAPWDIGADDVLGVTAVDLVSFTATGLDQEVRLEWETGWETENLGFFIYRSEAEEGPYQIISSSAVPGLGDSPVGALYRYVDSGLTNGKTYYYMLEDFEFTGRATRHGPVWATPEEGADLKEDEPIDEEPATAEIVYGDPADTSFRITSRRKGELVLELETGGFHAHVGEDGSVQLEIPGFVEETAEGMLSVPVKRAWVEAVAGRKVKLVSVRAHDVETVTGLRPQEAQAPQVVVTESGAVIAGKRKARRRGSRAAGMVPESAARVVSVGFQGDVKKALVELAPVRWDEKTGELSLARRLVVRLRFKGKEKGEQSLGGSRGRRVRGGPLGRRSSGVVARFGVCQAGLYGVRFEEVFGPRAKRSLPTSDLRLSRQGEPVPYHVEPPIGSFGPGSMLFFTSRGAGITPYSQEVVYELERGQPGEEMPLVSASSSSSGAAADTYRHRESREEDHVFGSTVLDTPHYWFWETILNGTEKTFGFEADAVVPGSEPARLDLWIRGASLQEGTDFRLGVSVNGGWVAEPVWIGDGSRHLAVEFLPELLREGANELAFRNATDAYSGVVLDRFEVSYPRRSMAMEGTLAGSWSESGSAEVTGVSSPVYVVDVSEERPRWLEGPEESGESVRFWAESGNRYLVVSRTAVLHPDVRKAQPSGLRRTTHGADYLVIGPRELLEAVEPLLSLRRSQGLRTQAVALEDIYAEFGYGELGPEAVREFLSYAYHQWREPSPRYVVLLGDGTFDYKGNLDTGVPNVLPPLLVKTSYMWTASDPALAAVNGDDVLPDLAIGRLPVETVEETRALVEKLVVWENMGEGFSGSVVFVADDADKGGDFKADAEEIASRFFSPEEVTKIYLSDLGTEATRSAIVEAFDVGASLMSYTGHGGTRLWASENIFDKSTIGTLAPQSQQPVVLTFNCYNGNFYLPYADYDSLAEELLKAEGRGAVAAFAPSGLSLNRPAQWLHQALIEELRSGKHLTLGDALLAAQETYAATGALPELLSLFHLFGDPALRIQ